MRNRGMGGGGTPWKLPGLGGWVGGQLVIHGEAEGVFFRMDAFRRWMMMMREMDGFGWCGSFCRAFETCVHDNDDDDDDDDIYICIHTYGDHPAVTPSYSIMGDTFYAN